MKRPGRLARLAIAACLAGCLSACAGLSTRFVSSEGRSAHASASLTAPCADLVEIPPDPSDDEQWGLWGKDRANFAECRAMNAAKAETIKALQAQGAR